MLNLYQDALFANSPAKIFGQDVGDLSVVQSAALYFTNNPFYFGIDLTKLDIDIRSTELLSSLSYCLVILKKSFPFKNQSLWVNESLKIRDEILKMKDDEIKEDILLLKTYFDYSNRTHPSFHSGKSPTTVIPYHYCLVYALMRYFKMSESECWNMPILRAMCYYATISHNMGNNDLYNEMDAAATDKDVDERI